MCGHAHPKTRGNHLGIFDEIHQALGRPTLGKDSTSQAPKSRTSRAVRPKRSMSSLEVPVATLATGVFVSQLLAGNPHRHVFWITLWCHQPHVVLENPEAQWRFLVGKTPINGVFFTAMFDYQREKKKMWTY